MVPWEGMSLERTPFGARQIQKQALYLVCALNYTEPKGSHPSKIQIKNLIISDSLFGTLGGKAAGAFFVMCSLNNQTSLLFVCALYFTEPWVLSHCTNIICPLRQPIILVPWEGIEPPTLSLGRRRSIHWATKACVYYNPSSIRLTKHSISCIV